MSSPLCGSCAVTFTIFKRKNRCTACRLFYCSACFKKGQSLPQRNTKHCLKCHALSDSNPLIPSELMLLSVKDLKAFLQQNNVSSAGCREKQDLVEVIVNHQRPNTTTAASSSSTHVDTSTSFNQQPSSSQQRQDFFGFMRDLTEGLDSDGTSNSEGLLHSFISAMDVDGSMSNVESTSSHNHFATNDSSSPHQPSSAWSMKNDGSKASCVHLNNIQNANEIQTLSVKELKRVLDENFVDYKGCCEKEELVQRTIMLWQSKKMNVDESANADGITGETNLCKVCMDSATDCVLLECGHLVTCVECGKKLKECPMCRQNITRIVRVFKS